MTTPTSLVQTTLRACLDELRTVEHITVTDSGATDDSRLRFHWSHQRPGTGAGTISRESWPTYGEAALAAVAIARAKGLPCDPIVELCARDAEVDMAQDSAAAAGYWWR